MPTKNWTRAIILLAAATWLIASMLMGLSANRNWLRPLSITMSVVVLLMSLFDIILWRFLPNWIVKIPNLRGTWKVQISSSFKDGKKPVELVCFLVIWQTYSQIHIEMLFPKSESGSTSASIVSSDGTTELWYSYRSIAHALNRKGNPPHMGAARLRVAMGQKIKLAGDYWTDRETFGRMETKDRIKKLVSDYEEASNLFS